MPVCFALCDKETGERVPLAKVDDAICEHFSVVPDERKYYHQWYDIIGFRLAMGETLQEMRDEFASLSAGYEDKLAIVKFLQERYVSEAWYSPYK